MFKIILLSLSVGTGFGSLGLLGAILAWKTMPPKVRKIWPMLKNHFAFKNSSKSLKFKPQIRQRTCGTVVYLEPMFAH